MDDERGPTCVGFLQRGIAYLADHGITRTERLITDNAWAYRYSVRAVRANHGIRQKFIKPDCPWQNGRVERPNRTLATKGAYRQAFSTNQDCRDALAPWLEHHNIRRRHLEPSAPHQRTDTKVLTGYSEERLSFAHSREPSVGGDNT